MLCVVFEPWWARVWSAVNYASSLLCARDICSSCGIELTCSCLTRSGNIVDVQYVFSFPELGTMKTYIPPWAYLSLLRPERAPLHFAGKHHEDES